MEADEDQLAKSGGLDNAPGASTFPRFLHLPGELQWKVWSFFCLETTAEPSEPYLLGFIFDTEIGRIFEGDALVRTTAASRALLAINQDSRQFALRALPDTLAIRGGESLIRFRRERDVVIIVDVNKDWRYNCEQYPYISGFFDQVVNLLIPWYLYSPMGLYRQLPNLKVVYHLYNPKYYDLHDLAWCFSDSIHRSKSLNLPDTTVYWPDLVYHREDAKKNIPGDKFPAGVNLFKTAEKIEESNGSEDELDFLTAKDRKHLKRVRVWPMVASGFMDVWRPKDYLPTNEWTEEELALLTPDQPLPSYHWVHPRWVPRPWEAFGLY